MDPVVHFEMPAEDKKRVSDFYSGAFGWQMQQLGPEMGEYILATTAPTDQPGTPPKQPGTINGGFYQKSKDNQHPHVVISVKDIRESMKKVEAAGGTIVGGQNPGEPDEIPGIGTYISFKDTEGNVVGMLQPAPMQ